MRKFAISLILVAAAVLQSPTPSTAQNLATRHSARPRLIVNITVSGLPVGMLESLRPNLSADGFNRLSYSGMTYRSANFDYMQTLSPAGLATITTGVDPAMHGVVADTWVDYVTGARVSLVADPSVDGVGGDAGGERYSPLHIVMPTVGDRLRAESPGSKVLSIAADPTSAIVMAGRGGTAYWMDPQRAVWVSSSAYVPTLAPWVAACNTSRPANLYVESGWTPARPMRMYINAANTIFGGEGGGSRLTSFRRGSTTDYNALIESPAGNSLVADLARRALTGEELGKDEQTDLLNICFDASRQIIQRYGTASMEAEDMLYRLDMDLGGLVDAIVNHVGGLGNVLFVLTSDSGAATDPAERFNVPQFRTILNSFISVQFGPGDWVLDYIDRQVYLNRNLIYTSGLSLADVQARAAAFVLQFRGVSHVLTSTALTGGYFGSGWGRMMQHGFYPRRGGDLVLNLMPGWVEDRAGTRTLSGSMYEYDTHVPLVLYGWRIPPGVESDEAVNMTQIAPTIAWIAAVGRPTASDGVRLPGLDAPAGMGVIPATQTATP